MRTALCLTFGFAFILISWRPASCDIYRYKDKDGVWHFTNVKSEKQYTLYIRTRTEDPISVISDYGAIIGKAAERFRVEPFLIQAVIRAESDFHNRAVSPKGAQGLMQLMPETAQHMAVEDPFDPEDNIYGGTRYLSILLERFKKDVKLALAAYNAGPEKVEAYNGVPPYPETEAFIKRVFDYYNSYKLGKK